jgi:hypothetical protein
MFYYRLVEGDYTGFNHFDFHLCVCSVEHKLVVLMDGHVFLLCRVKLAMVCHMYSFVSILGKESGKRQDFIVINVRQQ